jgi:hypothetical protein
MSDTRDVPAPTPPNSASGKPQRRMTARWRYTNQLNARASTGPRTARGKARVARNAVTHGLSVPALSDPGFAPEVVDLAHKIAQSVLGRGLDEAGHAFAWQIAETIIDLRRVRTAKRPLVAEIDADMENCDKPLKRLCRLDRYEGRAHARRKRAVHAFYEAVTGMRVPAALRQNKTHARKSQQFQVNNSKQAPR